MKKQIDIKELEARSELKKYLAYKIGSAMPAECRDVLSSKIKLSADRYKLLDKMVADGDIIATGDDYYANYSISSEECLSILWDITNKECDAYKIIARKFDYSYMWSFNNSPSIHLRDLLLKWRDKEDISGCNLYDFGDLDSIGDVIAMLPYDKNWAPIINDLDIQSFFYIVVISIEKVVFSLDNDKIEGCINTFAMNSKWANSHKKLFNNLFLLFSHVLKGKINELANLSFNETPDSLFIQAMYAHYNGNIKGALTLYRKGIKAANESKVIIPFNPLYTLYYVMALSKDNAAASVTKLGKIYDYIEKSQDATYISISILIGHLLDKSVTSDIEWVAENWMDISPLELVLAVLVIQHFKLYELPSEMVRLAERILNNDRFKLLQLESAYAIPLFEQRRETLSKELQLEPIFQHYRKPTLWEKNIANITDLLTRSNVKIDSGVKAKGSSSRVIYLLDSDKNFYPRLQKSKDGISWSGGRNIALNTFAGGSTDGMTDVDRIVAQYVKAYDTWNGRSYTLRSDKIFGALINHPNVYCYDNPSVAIQILKETPYIQVIDDNKGGFIVTTNVGVIGQSNTVVKKENDTLYRVFELSSLQSSILLLIQRNPLYPSEARESLTKMIVNVAPIITIHSDIATESENLKSVKGSSKITVQILPISNGVKVELFVKPLEDTPPYCKVNDKIESSIAIHNGEKVIVKRNIKQEQKNYAVINKIMQDIEGDSSVEGEVIYSDMYECLELIGKLQEHTKIARIEWPKGVKLNIKGSVNFDNIKLSVRERGSWFEVDGKVEVDKNLQITLAELLDKMRSSKGRFVELSKDDYIALSDDIMSRLSELDANLTRDRKNLKLSSFNTGIIGDLEQEGAAVTADEAFTSLRNRIESADKVDITIPTTLQAELRDYQVDGYYWLSRLAAWGAGACLADDMGLGKTVQSIAVLLSKADSGASLIVAPASVIHNWKSELQKFAPTLNCMVLHEVNDRAKAIADAADYDIILTTYGLLNNIREAVTAKKWSVILLDEAHNIKNRDTKSSKVVMSLTGDFRVVLTGTPIQNHLSEIWNLFQFTNPGLLGSFDYFNENYITPIERDSDKIRQKQLKRLLSPFILRRTKSEVLDELPQKTEIIHRVELSDSERAFYENIRQRAIANMESGTLTPLQTIVEITRLRQAACHPALIENSMQMPSAKINRFMELATELVENRHRALVFSQFTSFLHLVKAELESKGISYLYLDGSTPIKEREKLVKSFQQGDVPIFFISLKAGGTGLNLTAADYVIHLDPWWNPAIEDQASDRSHRIGQTRPVTIYKLIASQTIEEKIIELHKTKRSLADSLLEGSNMSHKLSKEEMLSLLKGD